MTLPIVFGVGMGLGLLAVSCGGEGEELPPLPTPAPEPKSCVAEDETLLSQERPIAEFAPHDRCLFEGELRWRREAIESRVPRPQSINTSIVCFRREDLVRSKCFARPLDPQDPFPLAECLVVSEYLSWREGLLTDPLPERYSGSAALCVPDLYNLLCVGQIFFYAGPGAPPAIHAPEMTPPEAWAEILRECEEFSRP